MAEELRSTVVHTPAERTRVTATVSKGWWGRIFDSVLILAAFLGALLQTLGDFNFASLGFSDRTVAWIAFGLFIVRFALAWRPVRLVDVKAEPAGGQG